jgi:hypothetical protein
MLIPNFPGGWVWLKKIASVPQVRFGEKVNLSTPLSCALVVVVVVVVSLTHSFGRRCLF